MLLFLTSILTTWPLTSLWFYLFPTFSSSLQLPQNWLILGTGIIVKEVREQEDTQWGSGLFCRQISVPSYIEYLCTEKIVCRKGKRIFCYNTLIYFPQHKIVEFKMQWDLKFSVKKTSKSLTPHLYQTPNRPVYLFIYSYFCFACLEELLESKELFKNYVSSLHKFWLGKKAIKMKNSHYHRRLNTDDVWVVQGTLLSKSFSSLAQRSKLLHLE